MSRKAHSYQVNLVPDDEGGYTVLVPSLPGCVSYGATVEEATAQARQAILLHLENLKAHHLPIPAEEQQPVFTTIVNVTLSRA